MLGPWQADPVRPDPGVVDRADRACRIALGEVEDPALPPDIARVLVDSRGAARLQLLYAGGPFEAVCPDVVVLPSGAVEPATVPGTAWEMRGPGVRVDPTELLPLTVGASGPDVGSYIVGYAGTAIATVTVGVPARPRIAATVEGGRFMAWWPGATSGEIRFVGFDEAGTKVADETVGAH